MKDTEEEFVPVLDEAELKEGSMKLVTVEGTPVLLVKVQGKIFALDNRCPHMSCGLSGGLLEGHVIICPCHDWRFDLKTGEYEKEKAITLTKFEWKRKAGKICIKLEQDTEE